MAARIGQLCRQVLPQAFERQRRQLPAIQRFLDTRLPEPLAGEVSLLCADDREIVVAAASPPLASFLRLHRHEIETQLEQAFGRRRSLRIRAMPATASRLPPVAGPAAPRPVGAAAITALERSALAIDDEGLRQSLLSLARTLRGNAKRVP